MIAGRPLYGTTAWRRVRMKIHKWKDIRDKRFPPETIRQLHAEAVQQLLEMNLKAIREMSGKTQAELAELTGMAQSEISRLERREDNLVSTLRKVIESLGGELEIRANFGDKSVRLVA